MPYKQAIVVRKDLKMGIGKASAQVAHASVGAMKEADKRSVELWELEGAKKIVLKVENLKSLNEVRKRAEADRLPYFVVRDAGLTQIKRGVVTCIGIGPAEDDKIDELTGMLKLL